MIEVSRVTPLLFCCVPNVLFSCGRRAASTAAEGRCAMQAGRQLQKRVRHRTSAPIRRDHAGTTCSPTLEVEVPFEGLRGGKYA